MSILWERSLVPWLDADGDPYSGANAYFYDAGTLTPLVTYTTADLSIPNPFPVPANAGGMFPPIFLPEQIIYHLRIQDAGGSTIWDVDNISVPTTVVPDPPSGGTDTQYLFNTGDIKTAWRASVPTGFVRCNSRTIGNAASGATERANADTSALFQFLWTEDPTLTVTGGRGATAAGDYAASKTIALPDLRGRAMFGLDGMGAGDANRILDADTTGTNSNVLGAIGGESKHTLITAELPAHNHTITVTDPGHTHTMPQGQTAASTPQTYTSGDDYTATAFNSPPTGSSTTGITAVSVNTGSGTAHNNMPPFAQVQFFIKL